MAEPVRKMAEPARKRRLSSSQLSQREALVSDRQLLGKQVVLLTLFGRGAFMTVLILSGIFGSSDLRFKAGILVAGALFGCFWALDVFRLINRTRRLANLIDAMDEVTSDLEWQDRVIRHQYSLRYSLAERLASQYQFLEPLLWFTGLVVVIFEKFN
jgi:hypothetical protein